MQTLDDGKVIVLDSRVIKTFEYTSYTPLPCTASPLQPYQIRNENSGVDGDAALEKRKRKRSKYQPNQPELDFNARHESIQPHLSLALEKLHAWMGEKNSTTIPQALGLDTQSPELNKSTQPSSCFLPPPSPPLDFIALAALRKVIKPKFSWIKEDIEHERYNEEKEEEEFSSTTLIDLFEELIRNEANKERPAIVFEQYPVLLPPQSSFLLSDVSSGLRPLLTNYRNKFQCIVIDPPWENRSVKRSATRGGGGGGGSKGGGGASGSPSPFLSSSCSYQLLPNRKLLALPVADLAAPGCLVALWVTNREKLRKFIEAELLLKWKLKHVATWHWLKVAQDGRPVTPLDAAHRRPYESLLLCYRKPDSLPPDDCKYIDNSSSSQLTTHFAAEDAVPCSLPDNLVIVSVPTEHSRKPFVGNLLQRHVPVDEAGAKQCCLEMFAREMHSGWVSWGNEVLKFQGTENFVAAAAAGEAGEEEERA